MSEEGGRSRGRAKGRTRGPTAVAAAERRQEQAPGPAPTVTQPAGGRRNHRGVPRTDAPRQPEVEGAAQRMAGLEISESAGRGASRRRQDEYGNDNTRPPNLTDKRGTSGEAITIVANYFELLSKPAWAIQQYHVEFAPNVESSFMRRVLLGAHRETFGSCYLFDGMSDLKTITKLENTLTEVFSKRKTDDTTIRITLKHVAELGPHHPELGRLFNTQMRRNLSHLKFQLLGRHYFDQNAISEVPQYSLQVWQGVVTSIRQMEEKLMMVVDTVHKVVRKETALEIIKGIVNKNPNSYQEECIKELVGCIVMTRYNNRTYRIEDICWDMNPESSFESRTGPMVYKDYYMKQYDLRIQDGKQPLMYCISKEKETRGGQRQQKKIYLVPELCCMTGLTDSMRSNYTMMRDLAAQTKLDPNHRVRNLNTFINRVNNNEDVSREMGTWGLRFSDSLVRFKSRVLPAEPIVQGSHKYGYDQKSADFTREMRGKAMHSTVNLDDWLVICTQRDRPSCVEFINTINKVCPPMGMRVRDPRIVAIVNDRVATYIQALRENMTKGTAIVVFIVPNNKKDRYDALKKNTCIDTPIPSQVVISRNLSKPKMLMSITTKIGIQLNCKLGGEAWAVEIPLKAGVMIVGFDTYHDSSKRGRSAGGFVASLNQSFTRWYSRVSFHQSGGWQEMSNNLKTHLTQALRQYQQFNKRLPNLILFYRDGVGDGQIRYVKEFEVDQFKRTLVELIPDACKDGEPRCAFIVVNKRINTRFFSEVGQNRYTNPPPGTVVDSVVTRADRYDFFLVSQSVKEGTVAPTMYNVISDGSGLRPEHQQRLAYKLTHLYYNWPGTIRVPAPCQYAHKLAFLTGQSLHREPAESLSNTLFYL